MSAAYDETPPVGPDLEDEDGDLLAKFEDWDKALDAHWGEWLKDAEEDYAFVAGEQWADEDKTAMEGLGRIPVTFNRTATTIDAVSGAEITGRQQVIYEPRQVSSTAQNEVLTKGADWIRDECDAEHEESEASRDCLICGIGDTETRMDYEVEADGQIMIERVDPLEVLWDPSSRKANFEDARYVRRKRAYSQAEFDENWPDEAGGGPDGATRSPTVVDPKTRYTSGTGGGDDRPDEVWVSEYQWFERVPFFRVAIPDPQTGVSSMHEVSAAQHAEIKKVAPGTPSARQFRRRYRRAVVGSGRILEKGDIEVGDFTYKAMTGKRDRNRGVWYGLVRAMKDPQRYSNKLFSSILNMLMTNAKGGWLIEEGAVGDVRDFEATLSDPGAITTVATGTLSGDHPKMREKTPPVYPQGQDRLMILSTEAVRDVTGVNQEMLGLADRQQPGILEHQRKQAAYGILSPFFDAFRRYRKGQGRLLLQFMQRFLPPDFLVRIVGQDGSPTYQAIGTALDPGTTRFNVIIDDTPAGPNEKAQTWQMIVQLMPILQEADLPPDAWATMIDYSPFPTGLAAALKKAILQKAQEPPDPMQQLAAGKVQAETADKNASAAHHQAQAAYLNEQAGAHSGAQDASAARDRAEAARATVQAIQETVQGQAAPDPTKLF